MRFAVDRSKSWANRKPNTTVAKFCDPSSGRYAFSLLPVLTDEKTRGNGNTNTTSEEHDAVNGILSGRPRWWR